MSGFQEDFEEDVKEDFYEDLPEDVLEEAARYDKLDDFRGLVENDNTYVFQSNHIEVFHTAIQHESQQVLTYLLRFPHFQDEVDTGLALQTAVDSGANISAEILLDNGADANKANPISLAAKNGNFDLVVSLIARGGNVNDLQATKPPLCEACRSRSALIPKVSVMKLLLLKGADVNRRDHRGTSPLQILLDKREFLIAQFLIDESDIDLESVGDLGTVLAEACQASKPEVMRFLLKNGADFNTTVLTRDLMDIIIKVQHAKKLDMMRILVEFNFDINKRDYNGHTYLIKAAIRGDIDAARSLFDLGVDTNATDLRGVTALTHAARGNSILRDRGVGQFAVAKYLAEKLATGDEGYNRLPGLRVTIRGNSREAIHNSLHDAVSLSRLIREGADVDDEYDGITPLGRACEQNLLEAVKVLLSAGASIEKSYGRGSNPLITSSFKGNTGIIEHLLGRGADITYKSPRGHALMAACSNRQHQAAIALIEAGIDIDDTSDGGFTCVHVAVVKKDFLMLEILIKRGAKVNGLTDKDVSPWMLAKLEEDKRSLNILGSNGAIISYQYLTDRNLNFEQTFSETSLLTSTQSITALSGQCKYIDHIMLEDGRCLHFATRDARRVLMKLLNSRAYPLYYIFPRQLSGTCWYFTIIAMMFVSDLTRQHTLPLRRSMIMGRTSVNGKKFSPSVAKTFMKMNTMIQAILLGNIGKVGLPLVNNEEVTLSLRDNNLIGLGLNCGATSSEISSIMIGLGDFLSEGNSSPFEKANVVLEYIGFEKTFEKTIGDTKYVADCIGISDDGHIISGLTLGGERYVYDSNSGRIKLDWKRFFTHTEEVFEIGGKSYSFGKSNVMVMYCIVE